MAEVCRHRRNGTSVIADNETRKFVSRENTRKRENKNQEEEGEEKSKE